jgi:DNA helicase IV
MLIALTAFLILHFGFGSSSMALPISRIEESIKHDVTDAGRKKEALAIVDQMKAAEKDFAKQHEKSIDKLDRLLAKRTASPGEIDQAQAPLVAESKAVRARLLALRFQLTAVLTAKEWAAVFPDPAAPAPAKKGL